MIPSLTLLASKMLINLVALGYPASLHLCDSTPKFPPYSHNPQTIVMLNATVPFSFLYHGGSCLHGRLGHNLLFSILSNWEGSLIFDRSALYFSSNPSCIASFVDLCPGWMDRSNTCMLYIAKFFDSFIRLILLSPNQRCRGEAASFVPHILGELKLFGIAHS